MKFKLLMLFFLVSASIKAQTLFNTRSQDILVHQISVLQSKQIIGFYDEPVSHNGIVDTFFTQVVLFDSNFVTQKKIRLPVYSTIFSGQTSIPAYLGTFEGKYLIFLTSTVQKAGGGIDSSKSARYLYEIDSSLNIRQLKRISFGTEWFYNGCEVKVCFQDSSSFYVCNAGFDLTDPTAKYKKMVIYKINKDLDTLAQISSYNAEITLPPININGKLWYTLAPHDFIDSLQRFPAYLDSTQLAPSDRYVELCNRTIIVDPQTMGIDTFLEFGWLHYGKQNSRTIGTRNYYRIPPPWSTWTSVEMSYQPSVHPVVYKGNVVVFGAFREQANNQVNVAHVILDTNYRNFSIKKPLTVVRSPYLSSIGARVVPVCVATNDQKGIYVLCRKDSSNLNPWNSHYLLQYYDTNVNFVWQKVVSYQYFCDYNEDRGFDMHFLNDGTLYTMLELSPSSTNHDSVYMYFAKIDPNGPNGAPIPSQVFTVGTHLLEVDELVSIYPNPSLDGQLQLEGIAAPYQLQITDMYGKQIWQTNHTSQTQWDFNAFPSGVYVVTTTDKFGKMARIKWVKQ